MINEHNAAALGPELEIPRNLPISRSAAAVLRILRALLLQWQE